MTSGSYHLMKSRMLFVPTTSITSGLDSSGWKTRIIAAGDGSTPSTALRRFASGRARTAWRCILTAPG